MNAYPTPELLSEDEIAAVLHALEDEARANQTSVLSHAGNIGHVEKADGSPATDEDERVEREITRNMQQRFPGVPVFGEESGYDDDTLPGMFVLVDPIDGTKSYLENIPAFTTMAVIIQNKEAVASMIFNITTGDMFTAQKDKGAFKNGERLDLASMPLSKVAYTKGRFIKPLDALMASKDVHCEVAPSGAGFGFIQVAAGLVAARFNMQGGGYLHDYAPGALLVREAGGVLIPIQEDTYTYKTRSFVACHPELAPLLQPHVQQLRTLERELV